MVAMAMFILFGIILAYVLYKLVRKLLGGLMSFNRKVENMAHRAEVAVEAFRFADQDPDVVKDS